MFLPVASKSTAVRANSGVWQHSKCSEAAACCQNTSSSFYLFVTSYADEMTWSSEQKEGEGTKTQTEETAMTAAFTRAFRAVDEEVVGSV